jgi:hypothetical protein
MSGEEMVRLRSGSGREDVLRALAVASRKKLTS